MSYKRITRLRPNLAFTRRKILERIVFIDKFLEGMLKANCLVIIIDEAGFGTDPLQKYAIAPVGSPAIRTFPRLAHNLTLNCAISRHGVELTQFMYRYGSSTETFSNFIVELINAAKEKYTENDFLLILDNLGSHQTSETVKAM